MRTIVVCAMFGFIVALLFGCGGDGGQVPNAGGPFGGRIISAAGITDDAKRDETLAKVAEEAAAAGDIENSARAVGGMKTAATRDAAAKTAALKFSEAGKIDEARALANLINLVTTRDEVLTVIAKAVPAKDGTPKDSAPPGQ